MKLEMSQVKISQEWINWIDSNLKNGCTVDMLANIMVGKGFPLVAAAQAISDIQHGRPLTEINALANNTSSGFIYEAPRVPMDVSFIDTNDKRVFIGAKVERPVIITFDNLMSHEECDQLIALSQSRMKSSRVVDNETGKEELHSERTSTGTFFKLCENEFVATLDRRIAEVMHWPMENGEGIQILNYQPGAEYRAHFDFFPYELKGSQQHLAVGGQRVSTLVMYLNDVEQGGETTFPDVGFSVVPKKGSAVYFEYCNSKGQVDPLSLHAGNPVIKGEKWIATKWMRQHKFN
jgi:prolyl 4-hydroxylase